MFNKRNTHYRVPSNHQDFERFCEACFRARLGEFATRLNSPAWAGQDGVDLHGRLGGRLVGVQCKKKNPDANHNHLTAEEVRDEAKKAAGFRPPLDEYLIVTTGVVDKSAFEEARKITEEHQKMGMFSVEVIDWEHLLRIAAETKGLLEEWYPSGEKRYWSRWGGAIVGLLLALVWLRIGSEEKVMEAVHTIRLARTGATPPGFRDAVKLIRDSKFDLSGENLSGAWIPCQDLSGLTLGRLMAEGVHATQARFANSELYGAWFNGGELNMSLFSGARIHSAYFQNANMLGANLSKADGRHANFARATLTGATLAGGFFNGADFSGADLSLAEMRGAVLEGASLSKVHLTDTNISGADLRKTRGLTQAMLDSACAQPGMPPKLSSGLTPPARACYQTEEEQWDRYARRAGAGMVGVFAVHQGFCRGGVLVPRAPDVPGKKGDEIEVDSVVMPLSP